MLDADDPAVVGDAKQEVAALGVQTRRSSLAPRVVTPLSPPVFLDARAQRRLELQGFRFAPLYQFLGVAMAAHILNKFFSASPAAASW